MENSWTPCGSARVRSTLKGLWLASEPPPLPQSSATAIPFTDLRSASLPTPSSPCRPPSQPPSQPPHDRQNYPTAGGHFTLPSPWTRQIVIRGPGIPGRATVVRPQRRLPSPLDLPPWIMINGVLLFLTLGERKQRAETSRVSNHVKPTFEHVIIAEILFHARAWDRIVSCRLR